MKVSFILYANMDPLLEKINACYNNPKNPSASKINQHAASGYSLFTHCSFDAIKNKHNYYREQDCMKLFSKDLKKHSKTIINYEKKEMMALTNKENESY